MEFISESLAPVYTAKKGYLDVDFIPVSIVSIFMAAHCTVHIV